MKIRYLFYFILLFPCALFAENWSMELGAAFYRPQKSVKEVYSGGWIDYQLEASRILNCNVEIWAGVNWIAKKHEESEDYFSSEGSCSSIEDKKRIWILPVSIGAKYFYYFTPRISAYVGGGIVYTFLRMERHGDYVKNAHSKHGLGAVIKSGIRYDWGDYTFVNVFVDYYSQKFDLSRSERELGIDRHELDLSGLKIGLGVGVYF